MKTFVTHPDNIEELRRLSTFTPGGVPFFGMPMKADALLPRYASKWEPPKERFFDYDKGDEVWLKYFGFGGYRQTTKPLILQIDLEEPKWGFNLLVMSS